MYTGKGKSPVRIAARAACYSFLCDLCVLCGESRIQFHRKGRKDRKEQAPSPREFAYTPPASPDFDLLKGAWRTYNEGIGPEVFMAVIAFRLSFHSHFSQNTTLTKAFWPNQGEFMENFAVGETVVVLYGKHQGHKATIMKFQPADAYKVKIEDGTVLFYSRKGLKKENCPDKVSG